MTRLIINVDVGRGGENITHLGFEKKGRTHHFVKIEEVNSEEFYEKDLEHFKRIYQEKYGPHGTVTIQEASDENIANLTRGVGKAFVEENAGPSKYFTQRGDPRAGILHGRRGRSRSHSRNHARAGVGGPIGPSILNKKTEEVRGEIDDVNEQIMKESKVLKTELASAVKENTNSSKVTFKDRPVEQKIKRLQEIAGNHYKTLMRRKYELFKNIHAKLYTREGLNSSNKFSITRKTNKSHRGRSMHRTTAKASYSRSTSRPRLSGRTIINSKELEELMHEIERAEQEQQRVIIKMSIAFYEKLLRDYNLPFNEEGLPVTNIINLFEGRRR